MSRRTLDQLPPPPLRYRLDRRSERPDGRIRFEQEKPAKREVRARSISVKKNAGGLKRFKKGRKRFVQALTLARQLARSVPQNTGPLRMSRSVIELNSLASSIYMRELRWHFGGWAWALISKPRWQDARTFTLIPKGLGVPAAELDDFDPKACLEAIRSNINRAGGTGADGFLILFLDAEFDPDTEIYHFHVHGLAAGCLLEVVRQLKPKRPKKGCRPSDKYRSDADVHKRVKVRKAPLTNLPDPLTYLLKSFWTSKWTGKVGSGALRRKNGKSRIPEPFHTQYLLWLHRHSISDISLMMRLRVTDNGFEVG